MACRLDGAKPLSEPMPEYCKLDPCEQTSVKSWSKFIYFHSRKRIWNCRRPFCLGLNVLTIRDERLRLPPRMDPITHTEHTHLSTLTIRDERLRLPPRMDPITHTEHTHLSTLTIRDERLRLPPHMDPITHTEHTHLSILAIRDERLRLPPRMDPITHTEHTHLSTLTIRDERLRLPPRMDPITHTEHTHLSTLTIRDERLRLPPRMDPITHTEHTHLSTLTIRDERLRLPPRMDPITHTEHTHLSITIIFLAQLILLIFDALYQWLGRSRHLGRESETGHDIVYFSKPGDTFFVLPSWRNAMPCLVLLCLVWPKIYHSHACLWLLAALVLLDFHNVFEVYYICGECEMDIHIY